MSAKKIKILHLITSLDTGGAEKMLLKLLTHIDRYQFENKVISLIAPGPVGDQIACLGVKVKTLGLARGVISPLGLVKLIKVIRNWKPDILQTWLYHADLLGYLASRLTGVRNLIWNIRCTNIDLKAYSKLTTLTIKACAYFSSFPAAIIINSENARAFHIENMGYQNANILTIFNGFDLIEFKPDIGSKLKIKNELKIPEDRMCIGMVGRYDHMKAHDIFLKAAGIIHKIYPQVVYILAGKNINHDNDNLITMIGKSGIGYSSVRLLGEREDVPDLMNTFDIFCLSSLGEGFPNVLGEAMACAVPCVATDVGHSSAIIGDTGIVVPPGDYQSLARGLLKMAGYSEKIRKDLGKKARQRIKVNYSLFEIVRQYENLYSAVSDQS